MSGDTCSPPQRQDGSNAAYAIECGELATKQKT